MLKIISADCVDVGIGQTEIDAALSAGTLHELVDTVAGLQAEQEARRSRRIVTLTCAVLVGIVAAGVWMV